MIKANDIGTTKKFLFQRISKSLLTLFYHHKSKKTWWPCHIILFMIKAFFIKTKILELKKCFEKSRFIQHFFFEKIRNFVRWCLCQKFTKFVRWRLCQKIPKFVRWRLCQKIQNFVRWRFFNCLNIPICKITEWNLWRKISKKFPSLSNGFSKIVFLR